MSRLLVDGVMRWSVELVRELFENEAGDLICSIPGSAHKPADKIRWIYTKNGEYTVRSGNFVARKSNEMGASSSASNGSFWKTPSKMPIHPRVHSFMWRFVHNILPAERNLFSKRSVPDMRCEICGIREEHVGHVLKGVWTGGRGLAAAGYSRHPGIDGCEWEGMV